MILIDPDARVPRAALPKRELSRFLADACERIGLAGEVSVLVTTDVRVQELNRTFRRKNKPTDVLSFPAGPCAPGPAGSEGISSGDLAISVDTARRQAETLGHPLGAEVRILMLHGLLHLAGFDHERDSGEMGRREATLRRHYGLPAGLIQRSGSGTAPGARPGQQRAQAAASIAAKRPSAGGKAAAAAKSGSGRQAGVR